MSRARGDRRSFTATLQQLRKKQEADEREHAAITLQKYARAILATRQAHRRREAILAIQCLLRGYAVRRFVRVRVRSLSPLASRDSIGMMAMASRRMSIRASGIEESLPVDHFGWKRGRLVTESGFSNEARIAPWIGEVSESVLRAPTDAFKPCGSGGSEAPGRHEEFTGPLPLMGHLLKKSPGAMFNSYQKRFVVLRDSNLYWWRSQKDAELLGTSGCRGTVDFTQVPCGVNQKRRPTKFGIAPVSGNWGNAQLTGTEDGRILEFDTAGSEHGVTRWLNAISDHLDWAYQQARQQ